MKQPLTRSSGFTVIELIVAIVFLAAAGGLFAWQMNNLSISYRDDARRTSINAIHYSLEEVYYQENGHYPEQINDDTLRSIDKEILVDPNGIKLGESDSDYRYEPTACNNGQCKSYSLRANLENEADYIRRSN